MLRIHETVRLELRNEIFILFVSVETNGLGFFYSIFNVQKIKKKYNAKAKNFAFSNNLGRFSLIFGHN